MIDQGPNARSVRLEIPRFTLIGATTRVGLLSAPMRSRFTPQTRLIIMDDLILPRLYCVVANYWTVRSIRQEQKKLPPVPAVLPELPIT